MEGKQNEVKVKYYKRDVANKSLERRTQSEKSLFMCRLEGLSRQLTKKFYLTSDLSDVNTKTNRDFGEKIGHNSAKKFVTSKCQCRQEQ